MYLINRMVQGISHFPDDGGGSPAAGGGAPVSGGQPSSGNAASAPAVASTPSEVEVDENTPIRIKGQEKPFSYKDVRGFQAQFTRASQEAARLKQELQKEKTQRESFEKQRQQAAQGQQPNPADQLLGQIKSLPYLSGEQAANVIGQIINGTGEQLRQRDAILYAALQQMKQMRDTLQTLNQSHVTSAFDGKINRWLKDGGYPVDSDTIELAKTIYLAHEGEDLDQEFPTIFKNYWERLNRSVTAQREGAARKAREARQFVPGKGGAAGPSSPLGLKGNESPKDIAEKLWANFGGGSET